MLIQTSIDEVRLNIVKAADQLLDGHNTGSLKHCQDDIRMRVAKDELAMTNALFDVRDIPKCQIPDDVQLLMGVVSEVVKTAGSGTTFVPANAGQSVLFARLSNALNASKRIIRETSMDEAPSVDSQTDREESAGDAPPQWIPPVFEPRDYTE